MKPNQTPSKSAIKYAALLLLESHDTTNNLAIKSLLRGLGFFALQQHVSSAMDDIAVELPLHVETNGIHRIYSLPSIDQVATTTHAPTITDDVPQSRVYTKRDGTTVVGFTDRKAPALISDEAWEVTSVGYGAVLWFNCSYTRDEVRQAYSSICCVEFHSVRASKV